MSAVPLVAAAGVLRVGVAGAEMFGRRHDDVRAAVERGDIKPFSDLLSGVRDRVQGEFVGVEVEEEGGA